MQMVLGIDGDFCESYDTPRILILYFKFWTSTQLNIVVCTFLTQNRLPRSYSEIEPHVVLSPVLYLCNVAFIRTRPCL